MTKVKQYLRQAIEDQLKSLQEVLQTINDGKYKIYVILDCPESKRIAERDLNDGAAIGGRSVISCKEGNLKGALRDVFKQFRKVYPKRVPPEPSVSFLHPNLHGPGAGIRIPKEIIKPVWKKVLKECNPA